ncbi:hypothetical protein HDU97_009894 [Phlyctochytrium planicorne]|nr:hypothetical protein HDU97_009894 [Phlyctochytrium planicorne]
MKFSLTILSFLTAIVVAASQVKSVSAQADVERHDIAQRLQSGELFRYTNDFDHNTRGNFEDLFNIDST